MTENNGMKKNSTTWSAVGLAVMVIALIAVVAYLIMNPKMLEGLLWIIIWVIIILVIVGVIIFLAMAVLAIPFYAKKGEQVQTDKSYQLNDVTPVKESASEQRTEQQVDAKTAAKKQTPAADHANDELTSGTGKH